MTLRLDHARIIISCALARGHEADFNPLAVLVLDAGGNVKAFEREDGASNLRFQVAFGKAFGAIGMGIGSRSLGEAAVARPHFAAGLTGAFGGAMIPVPGGVLIVDDSSGSGEIIGAVGVSGDNSDNDELAAIAGIEAAGFIARP